VDGFWQFMVTQKGPNKHEINEYGMKTGPKSNKKQEKNMQKQLRITKNHSINA